MAKVKKGEIKLSKKHGGKEFTNSFHIVGLVKPVRKKDEATDSWYDVEIFDTNTTQSGKPRRVTQFMVETAFKNELKVELAGMEKKDAYLWSSSDKKSQKIDWNDRLDKSKYPNDTYHLIDTEWDKAEKLGKLIKADMWVEVKGHYEFSEFTNEEGKTFKSVKRIIDQVNPLKNGEITITGLAKGDTFRAYDKEVEGNYLGMGKANDEGVATVKVGWLNPEGGELFITKVVNEENTTFTKLTYTDGESKPNERITIKNGVDSSVRVPKSDGGFEWVNYTRNFKSQEFKEINKFEMQLGIKSTYQDEKTMDTKVNGVFLGYGKEKSTPHDVELMVYYKEAEEGKQAFADAFGRLNKYDFLVVDGIDNNRAETALVEVQEVDDDNPFADVSEKTVEYEQVTTGTKKGLEILSYIQGTYKKELLTEEEFTPYVDSSDPFSNTTNSTPKSEPIEITSDDLPF